ncbi:MAG: DNA-binding response regulator [Halobacteriovorax sp.]|nr:DNA-binding response regulator [Halobacteriovorax sp.]
MEKILLIEDDNNLGQSISDFLISEQFEVTWVTSLSGAKKVKTDGYHLVILDWMLPDGQGVDFLRDFRNDGNQIPVIMLTAKSDLIDKVVGLESGANDYMTKPFEPRELLARIRVQLRQVDYSRVQDKGVVEISDLVLNLDTREVFWMKSPVEMTKMEFDFLRLLAENPNRALSRDEILNKVWGYDSYPSTRTVDTHVLQLRQKLSDELIETVRGIGYKLRA